jgi:beta-xylosidase
MYYTTREEASGFQCISRAVSARPEGPYVDGSARPLVCQTGAEGALCGSIDPSPFVDDGGRAYLLWKSDENSASCKTAPRIWGQALSADGLALLGAPQALLAKDRPWEGTIIEGPSMVYRHGRYFLFYSANGYETPNYAVGYATCEGPLGPCAKKTVDAPWLGSRGDMLGPGGEELFAGANGETWMAYHAWSAPRTTYASGGSRSLRFARVTFGGDAPALTKGDPVAER